ncbi:MAG TPA: hypothetical protein VGC30_11985 [Dokdonella sp.]
MSEPMQETDDVVPPIDDADVYETPSAERPAREELREDLDEIAASSKRAFDALCETVRADFGDLVETARDLVRERPLAAVATAAGLAYLIGRIKAKR